MRILSGDYNFTNSIFESMLSHVAFLVDLFDFNHFCFATSNLTAWGTIKTFWVYRLLCDAIQQILICILDSSHLR